MPVSRRGFALCFTLPTLIALVPTLSSLTASGQDGNLEIVCTAIATQILSVFSYPLGAVLWPIQQWLGFHSGILLPSEAVLFLIPLYCFLGYWQWYYLVPKIFERKI